jgi:hypothetical protein
LTSLRHLLPSLRAAPRAPPRIGGAIPDDEFPEVISASEEWRFQLRSLPYLSNAVYLNSLLREHLPQI